MKVTTIYSACLSLLFLHATLYAQTKPKPKAVPAKKVNPAAKQNSMEPKVAIQPTQVPIATIPVLYNEWPVIKPVNCGPAAKTADEFFNRGDFRNAATEYMKLVDKNPNNGKISYCMGLSYLLGNGDRSRALPFLEILLTDAASYPNLYYYLAKCYAYANRFDEAAGMFKKVLESPNPPVDKKWLGREIEMCENGKKLIGEKSNVLFENLGEKINTEYAEYLPFISSDESFLTFTSDRKTTENRKTSGLLASDVYMAGVELGSWMAPRNIGSVINTNQGDEQVVGVSADGQTLIYNFNSGGGEGNGDIFVGPFFQRQILKPFKLGPTINSPFFENAAAISPDGKTLYFSSNRPGGKGGFDLYRALILPNGEWSEALNLGPEINTPYDDDFPFLSMDGKELYFASKGHNSMGGYDVFKASLNASDDWENVINLGYPVNNAYDNKGICVSGKGRYAYASYQTNPSPAAHTDNPSAAELANGPLGESDLYRVVFQSVDAELCVLRGLISTSGNGGGITKPSISINRLSDNSLVGQVAPNDKNIFVIILPPGEYKLSAKCEGFKDYEEAIAIMGKGSFVPFVEKNILLSPR